MTLRAQLLDCPTFWTVKLDELSSNSILIPTKSQERPSRNAKLSNAAFAMSGYNDNSAERSRSGAPSIMNGDRIWSEVQRAKNLNSKSNTRSGNSITKKNTINRKAKPEEPGVAALRSALGGLEVESEDAKDVASFWAAYPKEIDFDALTKASEDDIFALPDHLIVDAELLKVAYKYTIHEVVKYANAYQRDISLTVESLQERLGEAFASLSVDLHTDYDVIRRVFRMQFCQYHNLKERPEWSNDEALDDWFEYEENAELKAPPNADDATLPDDGNTASLPW